MVSFALPFCSPITFLRLEGQQTFLTTETNQCTKTFALEFPT